jgi:hypothetical protein
VSQTRGISDVELAMDFEPIEKFDRLVLLSISSRPVALHP